MGLDGLLGLVRFGGRPRLDCGCALFRAVFASATGEDVPCVALRLPNNFAADHRLLVLGPKVPRFLCPCAPVPYVANRLRAYIIFDRKGTGISARIAQAGSTGKGACIPTTVDFHRLSLIQQCTRMLSRSDFAFKLPQVFITQKYCF